MSRVWPSTASAGRGASAAAVVSRAIANPRLNFMAVFPLLALRDQGLLLADHLEDGPLLGRSVRIALVLEHGVLRLGLVRAARTVAGQDVDDVRIAVVVGAAAEAVLALELVDLAGHQVLALGEAFV